MVILDQHDWGLGSVPTETVVSDSQSRRHEHYSPRQRQDLGDTGEGDVEAD